MSGKRIEAQRPGKIEKHITAVLPPAQGNKTMILPGGLRIENLPELLLAQVILIHMGCGRMNSAEPADPILKVNSGK
jgi:hypothetical protein